VTSNRFGALVSAIETVGAMQLPATIAYYGPAATGVWTIIQGIRAIRRVLPSRAGAGSDDEQLDLVAVHSRGDLM
jgi:hypothetical protein